MDLIGYKIAIVILLIICSALVIAVINLKNNLDVAKQKIDQLNQINEQDRIEFEKQHEADNEVIKKLTEFVKEKIKDKYKENDRLYKELEKAKDVNEYGETQAPI
jgi:5-bromo-4-chloroindolyl phosphate hydrolysis protein